jgi:hypothetical protein
VGAAKKYQPPLNFEPSSDCHNDVVVCRGWSGSTTAGGVVPAMDWKLLENRFRPVSLVFDKLTSQIWNFQYFEKLK